MRAFAEALDAVPMALAENSGLSPIEALGNIKSRQAKEKNTRLGVDCMQTGSNGKFKSSTPSLWIALLPSMHHYLHLACFNSDTYFLFLSPPSYTHAAWITVGNAWLRRPVVHPLPASAPPRDVALYPHASSSSRDIQCRNHDAR